MLNIKLNPELGVVVVAGGDVKRFGRRNKLLAKLAGVPVFIHSLKKFHRLCPAGSLVLVVKKSETAKFANALKEYLPNVDVRIAYAGKTRMHSVMSGISILPMTVRYVAVHDAARPLATSDILVLAYRMARKHGGAVVAKKMTDTIKQSIRKCFVLKTLDRGNIWSVETPQVFPLDKLMASYVRAFGKGLEFTDDSAVMESAGHQPYLLEYPQSNIKITFPEDLKIASICLKRK